MNHIETLISRKDTPTNEPETVNSCPPPNAGELSDNSVSSNTINSQEIQLPQAETPQEEQERAVDEASVLSNGQNDSVDLSVDMEESLPAVSPPKQDDPPPPEVASPPPLPTLPPLPLPPAGPNDVLDEDFDISPPASPFVEKKPATPVKRGIRDLPLPPGIKEEDIMSPDIEDASPAGGDNDEAENSETSSFQTSQSQMK